MAFVYNDLILESFAEFQDVLDHDQRLFITNEGLSDSVVYPSLIRATEKILTKIKDSGWWKNITTSDVNPAYILTRHNDFTDLCVYLALSDYILPSIADFGTADNAEVQKMQYYQQKFIGSFEELINAGDWYDFNNDSTIDTTEKKGGSILPRRRI